MAMSLAAAASARQRLSDINPDGANYFIDKLLVQIYDHFDEQYLTDVTFKLSNPTALVTAHRLILSAASPYFKELFKSDSGICPLVDITDIDSDTFERLITFCYTGKALITIDNVDRMLRAALILQLHDVVTNCVDFVIEHLTTDYRLERVYTLERDTQCRLLSEKILEYEIANFMSVIQSAEFLNFGASKLQTILESDDLNVPTEKDVFEAVKRWYEYDASVRKEFLPDIISYLRLTQFDTNFIMKNVKPLPGCLVVALQAVSWVNVPSTRDDLSLRSTNQRSGWSDQSAFLAFQTSPGVPTTIFQYNKTEDLWQKWVDIKVDFQTFRVIFMDDNLIFIGGRRNENPINEVSCWTLKTKTFQQLPPMGQPRWLHCLVILNDTIYAIGGKGANDEILKSVEMYSVSNGWKSISNMITSRCYANAVVLNGKIYVIGGRDKSVLKSMEYYDPSTDCWTQCADMNEKHSNPGATVHNGQIFVAGGKNEIFSPTVERYDPQRNKWTKMCSLSIGLELIECFSIDNQLWAVGGYNKDSKNYVSIYDEQNDKWIDKKQLPLAGRYYCFSAPKSLLNSE